tara:strand:+ start:631 stop:972 length:342 start_codon:yes stop_codon:yes gene_type:complete
MKYLITYITSAGNETHRDVEAATEMEAKELVLNNLGARQVLTVKSIKDDKIKQTHPSMNELEDYVVFLSELRNSRMNAIVNSEVSGITHIQYDNELQILKPVINKLKSIINNQ